MSNTATKLTPAAESAAEVSTWQKKLLPFMMAALVVLAIYSSVSNFYEIQIVQKQIESMQDINLDPIWQQMEKSPITDPFAYARWKTVSTLESHALRSRYHQARIVMMSRLYLIFLGFTTGMVMALIGAVFILGKLREAETKIGAEALDFKGSLSTTSPGLVLAALGTVLILSTIWARAEFNVVDSASYIAGRSFDSAPSPAAGQEPDSQRDILDRVKKRALETKR